MLEYAQAQFNLDGGTYYSPSFKIGKSTILGRVDGYITISPKLTGNDSVYVQASVDDTDFYDVDESEIVCSPGGLRQFKDGQPNLYYRLKCATQFDSAKILL